MATDTADLLWHCRVRPHQEAEACLIAPGQTFDKFSGTLLMPSQGGYASYVENQRSKVNRDVDPSSGAFGFFEWGPTVDVAALFVSRHFGSPARSVKLRGLCHGAKTGREVRIFRTALARAGGVEGVYVLGTDITPEAVAASQGDVIEWDFNRVPKDWLGAWDFIYSNTLDHAYHPGVAISAWRMSLRSPESLLVLHRSNAHSTVNIDVHDVYGGSLNNYCALLRTAGFEVVDVVRARVEAAGDTHDLIFAVRGEAPDIFTLNRESLFPEPG